MDLDQNHIKAWLCPVITLWYLQHSTVTMWCCKTQCHMANIAETCEYVPLRAYDYDLVHKWNNF